MAEQERLQTYASAFVHCLPVAERKSSDVHVALQRIVGGYDAGARRRLVSFSAEQKKDRPSLEVERNGLISRHDFCTALNYFFARRPELSFDPECVFDAFFTGERGALTGAEAFAPPSNERLNGSPKACAVRFATGEVETEYPLSLLQRCPAHAVRRSVLPSHPQEMEELEAAARVPDSGLCESVLGATAAHACSVMARPRRASLRDIAAGIHALYSGHAAGEWWAKGRTGGAAATQHSEQSAFAVASSDEASRRRQLLYLLRRKGRSGRQKSTWFDHLGSLGALLSTWNCQTNPARGRHDDGSRLAPSTSALGQKENENSVNFEQFVGALKHYLGDVRRADAGPRAADEECRVPFLRRDARLLFDAFGPDKSDRVKVVAIMRVVNSEASDVQSQPTPVVGNTRALRTVGRKSGGMSAPFYTDASTSNSRTWGCDRDTAKRAEAALAACADTRPPCNVAALLRYLQCALPQGRRHRGALLGALANYEEPWTSVHEHKSGPLETKIRSTAHHKTGWLSRREFGAALYSLLPRQKLDVVLAGAAALFEERAKQLEVDQVRRVLRSGDDVVAGDLAPWPHDGEEFDPHRGTTSASSGPPTHGGPTWLLHAVNVDDFCDWLARKLATDLRASSERAAQSRRWRGPLLTARPDSQNDLHSMVQPKRDTDSKQRRIKRLETRNLTPHSDAVVHRSDVPTISAQQRRTYAPHRPPPCLARRNQRKAAVRSAHTPGIQHDIEGSPEGKTVGLNRREVKDVVTAIKRAVRLHGAPATGTDVVSREQQRVLLERALGGFSTGGEKPVLSRGNLVASIRALLGERAAQFDESSDAGWKEHSTRMRARNPHWTGTDAQRKTFHAQWQARRAAGYGALFDEACEAMKAQQPEDGEGGESAAPANKTQLNFVRDTLGLDYGQRFSLNSRGSWAADPENQVPKFYAKYQEAKANGQAARVADTDYADARTVTLDAVVEFMRDPQECAFEAWDSRRQKAGFRAWKQGEETEGWISRDELERQSRPVPKAEAFTV